jgi:hypothetical protein
MGYQVEFNCLLVVPHSTLDLDTLTAGATYTLVKEKERLYPLNMPIEICNEAYEYYGKIAVRKLTLEAGKTELVIEVLKIFTPDEKKVYTNNFIKP